jgi:hypothetical protein
MIISLVITAFVASNTEYLEQVSSPSVKAKILNIHYGYFFLNYTNWLTPFTIESYNLVEPLGFAAETKRLKS